MIKISKMADYAVVVVFSVDSIFKKTSKFVTSEEVSNESGLGLPTTNQIIKSLSKGGILSSRRGVGGGVKLAKGLGDITLLEVIQSIDGDVEVTDCAKKKSECCSIVSICPVSDSWKIVNEKIVEVLRNIKIKDMF